MHVLSLYHVKYLTVKDSRVKIYIYICLCSIYIYIYMYIYICLCSSVICLSAGKAKMLNRGENRTRDLGVTSPHALPSELHISYLHLYKHI